MKGIIAGSRRRFGQQILEASQIFESNDIYMTFPSNKKVIDVWDGFPILEGDSPEASVRELEDGFLRAIDKAQFVYVVNPEGYIGKGTIFEIGYAHGTGKDIFAYDEIEDVIGHYLAGIFKPDEFVGFLRRERGLK